MYCNALQPSNVCTEHAARMVNEVQCSYVAGLGGQECGLEDRHADPDRPGEQICLIHAASIRDGACTHHQFQLAQ